MKISVPKETFPGERRVALTPLSAATLAKQGHNLLIESQAGREAGFPDTEYEEKGCRIARDRDHLFGEAEVVLQVRTLGANPEEGRADLDRLRSGQVLIGFAEPLTAGEALKELAAKQVSLFAVELMPRISRAQTMDALSSMATIAGYKAVLLAADRLPKMLPMLVTAAGTITPSRIFVVGAGVAGLQAIATARRLGGAVEAYDVRPEAKVQVLSLGAKFAEIELESADAQDEGGYAKEMGETFYQKQRGLMTHHVASSDVVITTAAVPGKKAPRLVSAAMVEKMARGSVVVDLAAERGGNCELTRPGETVVHHGVTILGPLNLPTTVPFHASQMYAKNISTFARHLLRDGSVRTDRDDPIVRETLVIEEGTIVHPRARQAMGLDVKSSAS